MPTRVLVVDDDALTREILGTVLNLQDLEVVTAADGAEALEVAAREHPDVIVLDVMMPRMDGFEACRKLKADPEMTLVPVILLTARDRAEDRDEGVAAGADAYLVKPFSPLKLIDVINELTGRVGG